MPVSIAVHAQKDTMHIVGMDTTVEFKTVQTEAISRRCKGWQRYLEANLNSDLGAKYLKPKRGQNNHVASDGIFPCRHLR